MPLFALNLIVLLGVNAVIATVATWLLPIRRRVAFFACMLAISPLALALASPNTMTAWNIAGYALNYLVIPCLFWKGPWARRAVCALLLVATEISSEMVFGLLIIFAGLNVNRDTIDASSIIARALCGVSMLAIGRAVAIAVRHAGWQGPAADKRERDAGRASTARAAAGGADAGASPNRPQGSARLRPRDCRAAQAPDRPYLLFLATQLGFLLVGSTIIMANRNTSPAIYLIMVVSVAVCLAADVLAFASLSRLGAALRERERAAALERQLAVYVHAAERTMRDAEDAARFRHDQRNHLQVLGALVERGERGRALAYVRALRRSLAELSATSELGDSGERPTPTPPARAASTTHARPSPPDPPSPASTGADPSPRALQPNPCKNPRRGTGAPQPLPSQSTVP